jgi:hypothetical protein
MANKKLDEVISEGWAGLQEQMTDIRSAEQAVDDLNKLCLRLFTSEDGAKFLEWLQKTYVDIPVAIPGSDSSHAYFNEGSRTVIRDILWKMDKARKM